MSTYAMVLFAPTVVLWLFTIYYLFKSERGGLRFDDDSLVGLLRFYLFLILSVISTALFAGVVTASIAN